MNRPKPGFPDAWGNMRTSVFPVTGPGTYAPYTAPSTGGQNVQVSGPSGVKTAVFAQGAVSRSGLYRAEVVQYEASSLNGVSVANSQIVLKWYVVATGSEAGAIDLSAETVDLFLIGDK